MKWVKALQKAVKDYRDMVFNAHSVLKDYRSYEEISATPLRNVIEEIEYFTPKLKEIARQQEAERLKAELAGKRNMVKPGRKGGL